MTLGSVERYQPDRLGRCGDRAVVLGGSIAGMTAARVLADGFDEVVVLERDPIPAEPVARTGVPQSSHPHALLEAGRATLEDFFPGFGEGVTAAGGLLIDNSRQMHYFDQGDFIASPRNRLPTYCASRALFEHVIRRAVSRFDGVVLRGECHATDYRLDEAGRAVTAVDYRGPGGSIDTLGADLVVDATGRASRTPQWLASNGYESPPVDEVRIDVTYSSLRIERPPDDRRTFLIPPSPPRTRGGAFIPIEDERWDVIVQGVHGDRSPGEPSAFREFAHSLPIAEFGTLVERQPWVSEEIHRYPFPASRRNRYEALESFPAGLVVIGDAIASFNPIYGQGMSVAALEALVLHHVLATDGLEDIAPRFFDRVTPVVDEAWGLAVGADFAFPQTTGPKPTGTDLLNWYVDRVVRTAQSDPVVSEAFARVTRLEKSGTSLLRPGIVLRILRQSFPALSKPSPGSEVDT